MTVDKIIFIVMILTALFIVVSRNYKRTIVAMGAFSLFASFCYLIYHAPDVAIAEAIIGSGLSTILYIVALKKHRSFYIYYTTSEKENGSDIKLRSQTDDVASKIRQYCIHHSLEVQSVFSWESPEEIANEHFYDLILYKKADKITIYGSDKELHVSAIKALLTKSFSEERIELADLSEEASI